MVWQKYITSIFRSHTVINWKQQRNSHYIVEWKWHNVEKERYISANEWCYFNFLQCLIGFQLHDLINATNKHYLGCFSKVVSNAICLSPVMMYYNIYNTGTKNISHLNLHPVSWINWMLGWNIFHIGSLRTHNADRTHTFMPTRDTFLSKFSHLLFGIDSRNE